jgi:hypothetical protein
MAMSNRLFFLSLLLVFSFGSVLSEPVGSFEGSLPVSCSGQTCDIGSGFNSQFCGNLLVESQFGEQCDGSNLGGMTCGSLLGSQYTGTLGCESDCTWDVASCRVGSTTVTTTGGGGGSSGGSSSGGSGSSRCVEDWSCGNWSLCDGGVQTRTCTDANTCGSERLMPSIVRSCNVSQEFSVEELDEGFSLGFLTGAAIGFIADPSASWWFWLIVIVVVYMLWRRYDTNKKMKMAAAAAAASAKKKKSSKKKSVKK